MSMIKLLVILGIVAFAGYYIVNMDDFSNKLSSDASTASEYFIDKSNKIITVVDLWANGPKQTYATSGSESIVFKAEEVPAEVIMTPPMPGNTNTAIEPIVLEEETEKLGDDDVKECENSFKSCVDAAHAKYGVYIQVSEVKIFNDELAWKFYEPKKSEYQPSFDDLNIDYPVIMIAAEAVGLGKFVATCKDGDFPSELNKGLPC